MPAKSSRWNGSSFPLFYRLGEDHLAHHVDAIALEEHVFRAGEADADGAEGHGVGRLLGCIGIRAHAHTRRLIAPLHELLKALELLGALRRFVAMDEARDDFRRRRLHLPRIHTAHRAVNRQPLAFLEGPAVHRGRPRLIVDLNRRRAADADFAHLPRDQCGV